MTDERRHAFGVSEIAGARAVIAAAMRVRPHLACDAGGNLTVRVERSEGVTAEDAAERIMALLLAAVNPATGWGAALDEVERVRTDIADAEELLREIRDGEVNPEDCADRFLRDHQPSELSAARAEMEWLKRVLESERRASLDELGQRDRSEEIITDVAAVLGCEEEWSNLHDHHDCLPELAQQAVDEVERLRVSAAENWKHVKRLEAERYILRAKVAELERLRHAYNAAEHEVGRLGDEAEKRDAEVERLNRILAAITDEVKLQCAQLDGYSDRISRREYKDRMADLAAFRDLANGVGPDGREIG